jgi:hypothetical protein
MSVFDSIDKLKAANEAEKSLLLGKVRELFEAEARLTVSEYGVWRLAWRKANQSHEVTGRSAEQLLEQLRAMTLKKVLHLKGT